MISKTCLNCNKTFECKGNRQKYCNHKCYSEYISKNPHSGCFKKGVSSWNKGKKGYKSGEDNPAWKGGKVKYNCQYCNKNIWDYPNTNRKYCSIECHNNSMKGQKPWNKDKPNYDMRGENHPRWNGGIGRHDNNRKRLEAKIWRRKVFNRDNYTCIWCGVKNVYLNAHHIKTWKNSPEFRYDIDNGITLCVSCHRLTFGKEKEYENFFQNLLKKAVNSGKVLTDNAEDNPEPSRDSNNSEGATTRSESNLDNNSPTSSAPERDDIV